MKRSASPKEKVWRKILESSTAMENLAQKNDWSALNELIESRQRLLYQFFSEPVARIHERSLEQIRDDIKVMLHQDQQTQRMSKQHQAVIADSLKTIKKGKMAIKGYQ